MSPLIITASSMINALGRGKNATLAALLNNHSGLQLSSNLDFSTWLGQVEGVNDYPLEDSLLTFNCRNNQLAKMTLDSDDFRDAINKAKVKYGADRIGVFLGSSTSGSEETEKAYLQRNEQGELPADYDFMHTHNFTSLLDYTQQSLGLTGVGQVISTACSSSAKVFSAAHRHIESGFCDAAIVGGVDTITQVSLYGFHSLQLTSTEPCRPCDENRDGISIGEAAGFALLETTSNVTSSDLNIMLKGYGESSDAYHMSSPHPEGRGAADAMRKALANADLSTDEIDYVNLHGTGTPANDAAEDKAVTNIFGSQTPCSSTKGWTGHTLGAAGITEALICMLILENQFLPANLNLKARDPALHMNILLENLTQENSITEQSIKNVITNSFGFGGSNCSLILGLKQ
ncbi:MAG: beta-ketoacyl-[acyl-carrier-protein] synthase family protein [Gammaproteobacteria bacterium]|nr:beta-ketoacyl-[acyl-carrier-protein] synthase family protein [Gammaproteobacteria bacterium]MCW8986327.1 beta-ketoacyl-[acyl-carrier-protein] synthase family protein [Gammaproteobacteria bacterium]MCW9031690.1 beta-ketoacyl-[acyl-carrier-protein] synthase family protein [Gammaproteobacteria bacterium]